MTSTAASTGLQWRSLRGRQATDGRGGGGHLPLLLVVHGRAGGVVPPEVERLRCDLQRRRATAVMLQPLTAGPVTPPLGRTPLLLVPLLLLPGTHVRGDVPGIAARLTRAGHRVHRLPFLGAWPAWLQRLRRLIREEEAAGAGTLLVHHPLRPGVSQRYLAMLGRDLARPLLPADRLDTYTPPHSGVITALPLALAANRMTEALQARAGSDSRHSFGHVIPPLLGHRGCRATLLDLLSQLP